PFEIDGYHLVEALLRHLLEQPEIAVTCIYEKAVQVPELPLDRGEHRVEVGEIADVGANGETSGSKRLLGRLQRPFIQAADGDARALSVEFLRCSQPDPAVTAGDKDILVREPAHCGHSVRSLRTCFHVFLLRCQAKAFRCLVMNASSVVGWRPPIFVTTS